MQLDATFFANISCRNSRQEMTVLLHLLSGQVYSAILQVIHLYPFVAIYVAMQTCLAWQNADWLKRKTPEEGQMRSIEWLQWEISIVSIHYKDILCMLSLLTFLNPKEKQQRKHKQKQAILLPFHILLTLPSSGTTHLQHADLLSSVLLGFGFNKIKVLVKSRPKQSAEAHVSRHKQSEYVFLCLFHILLCG